MQPPEEDEKITRRVVYEHQTSSRQNTGAIIAITLIVLATIVFIFMQIRHKPPKRSGELERVLTSAVCTVVSSPALLSH